MNKTVRIIVSILALLVIYRLLGVATGISGRVRIVLTFVIFWVLRSLALHLQNRYLSDRLRDMGVRDGTSPLEAFLAEPKWTGGWRFADAGLCILAAFGPPVLLSLLRREHITWDSQFTAQHLLAMMLGAGLYLVARSWLWRKLTQ